MSANCMSCNEDIRPPNEFWCAYTMFSPEINYVCGDCLKNIPDKQKIRFDEPPMFQILFSRRTSEIGNSGNYQSSGSKMEPPEFWVDANIVASYLSRGGNFLRELYPYYCIADLPNLIYPQVNTPQKLNNLTPESFTRIAGMLSRYGAPLEALLFKRKRSELVRPIVFKGDPGNLTENEKELAIELLETIIFNYF